MESVIATREEVQGFLSIQNYNLDRGSIHNFVSLYDDNYGNDGGDGDGEGFERGDGEGFGCGCGWGRGNGSGYGNSCGDGDIKALNGNIVDYIDSIPTIITQVRGNIACGYIVKVDLTLEFCYIAKIGDSFAHAKTLKDAYVYAEAKEMYRTPIDELVEKFKETFGSLDSEHTGKEFYDWHHILTGSCRMGRDEFCKSHDIDLKKMYSVRYFLDITKNAYGDHIINQIRKAYKITEE